LTSSLFVCGRLSRAQFERLSVPVWSGQISQRMAFLGSVAVGASAGEIYDDSACKVEIARLWSAIERAVGATHRAQADAPAKRPDVTAIPGAFIMEVA
jgi:hypothetical protein